MTSITLIPDQVDRMEINYSCGSNHSFSRIFAADIAVPTTWDCPHCGQPGTTDSACQTAEPSGTSRSHWDRLLERRSLDELAEMVAERIQQLRELKNA